MIEFLMGVVLGAIFFGGLYLTVQRLDGVKNPSALFLISFIIRMVVLIAGLFYISERGYKSVLLTLLGILVIRYIMIFAVNKAQTESSRKDLPSEMEEQ